MRAEISSFLDTTRLMNGLYKYFGELRAVKPANFPDHEFNSLDLRIM